MYLGSSPPHVWTAVRPRAPSISVITTEQIHGRLDVGRQHQRAELGVLGAGEGRLLLVGVPVARGEAVAAADDDVELDRARLERRPLEPVLGGRPRAEHDLGRALL